LPRRAASTTGIGWAGALSGQGRVEKVERLPHLRQRPLEGNPVPTFDDPVRGGADAEHEAPVGGAGQGRRLLRQERRATLEDTDDAGAQPRLLGPGSA
jgi:hypothetical protein